MSDENSAKEESEGGPVGGERLKKARREHDISVRDVAKELHLDEYKVRALEKNEFDVLGAPVFAKGHLRKYAELVGVDTDDVMTDYYQMNRSAAAPPVVGPKRKIPRDVNPMPWIVGVVMVVVFSVVAWWWFAMRSPAPVVSAEPAGLAPFVADIETAEPEPEAVLPEAADAQPVETASRDVPAEMAVDEPVAEEMTGDAVIEDGPAESAVQSYAPTPGAPQVEVDLAFTGDCWTEVTDAQGRRLYYDLGQEGRIITVSGDAPLRLILGDADNVSVSVDGRPWPVPASARSGRLARLTISRQ
jgi:cytoskeleton protein RodZ